MLIVGLVAGLLGGCVSSARYRALETKLKRVQMEYDDLSKWVLDGLNLPDGKLK